MVSKLEIKNLIDEVEIRYQQCWNTLSRIRSLDPSNIDSQSFLDFQPTLAQCLFDLDETYRYLHQEKLRIIEKKTKLAPKWLVHRLQLIREYQDVIKDTIAVGKVLGDAFAWIFYSEDRRFLKKHLKYQKNFHTPPGIGGKGELELIKRILLIENRLIIYHQLTNYLRIGDVSIYDLQQKQLWALGEIKTARGGPEKLDVTLSALGPAQDFYFNPDDQPEEMGSIEDLISPTLPAHMSSRLKRQLGEIARSFDVPKPDDKFKMSGDFHFADLKHLLERVKTSSIVYQKAGDGLLLIGLKDRKKSLSTRIMNRSSDKLIERLDDIPNQARSILNPKSEYNSLNTYSWHHPNPKYQPQLGMTPFFWWPLDSDLIKKVVFQDVLIFAIYNPGHFIPKLQKIGFQVEHTKDTNKFTVKKTSGNRTIKLENFHYFINLIALQLCSEEAVVKMVQDFMTIVETKINSGELPEAVNVEFNIHQYI